MATVIGDIAIQVGADIGPLVRELGKGSAAVSKFGADAQKGGAGMALATKAGIALGSAVVGAGVALASMTSAAMENIDALSKQARIAGVSVATFQAMAQVAEEAGVSSEELSKSIVKMQDAIGNAAKGTQAQVDAFAALGLSASNFAGLKTDEQFALLAEKISGIEDPVKRTSVALDIFGKSGAGLTDMMNGYGDAVANAAKFQSDFGLAVSDIDAQQIEAANDAMDRTKQAIVGLGTELAVTFAPGIEAVSLGLQMMIHDLLGAQTAMGEVFGKEAIAKAILGPELYNQLNSNAEAFALNAVRVGELKAAYDILGDSAGTISNMLTNIGQSLAIKGYTDTAISVETLAAKMRSLTAEFDAGTISGEEYRARMVASKDAAVKLLQQVELITGADMSDVIAQVGGLESALAKAGTKAFELTTAMSKISALGGAGASASASGTIKIGYAPDTSPHPLERPMDLGDYGSSGGGGGADTTAADLKAMQDRFASESELLQAKYDADLLALETFRQSKQLSDEAYNALELQIKADHEQAIADIEDKARSERFNAYSGAFGDLAALMASSNDKLFKIGQAASIGKAVVDGYEAAVSAWKHGMAIGGPGLATAFTAASLAKTGAMIAGIASASPRGGGGGQSAGGGGGVAASGGGSATSSAPLQVMLNTRGSGDMISMIDWGMALDRITEVAGDRGYIITRAAS